MSDKPYSFRGRRYLKVESEWMEVIDLHEIDWDGPALDLYHNLGNILMKFPDVTLEKRYGVYGEEDRLCFSETFVAVSDEKIVAALNSKVKKERSKTSALKQKKIERERKEYERLAKKYGPNNE